nr:DUF3570 domain-containing protein [Spongiibacter thalassae]
MVVPVQGEVAVAVTDNKKTQPTAGQALAALGAAALAIPGIVSEANAAAPLAEASFDYKYSAYREADLDRNKLGGGSPKRFEIDSHMLRFAAPAGTQSDIAVDLSFETLSGASPWFILPGSGDSGPVQIMSGASIKEERKDVQLTATHYFDKQWSLAVVGGYSTENDYEAVNVGAALDLEQAESQRTYSAGFGYSDDTLEPTDGRALADRVDRAAKTSLNAFVGVSQIINARTVVQGSLSYAVHDGYLSDPYKKYWVVDQSNTFADSRPDERTPMVVEAKLRHFVPGAKAALHLDYRFFDDNWEVTSHTVDAAWYQNLPGGWMLTPSLRYYTQTQAHFYAPYFFTARSDGLGSSDYRLSPYGAISARLMASKDWGGLTTQLEWESYRASADYSLEEVALENPALVEFDILTLGIHWKL